MMIEPTQEDIDFAEKALREGLVKTIELQALDAEIDEFCAVLPGVLDRITPTGWDYIFNREGSQMQQQIRLNVRVERARALDAFVASMEIGMIVHDSDRGPVTWRRDDPAELFAHLQEEVDELKALLDSGNASLGDVRREAADVANMAFMVADAMGALPRSDDNANMPPD
jgi:hypothetical protein